MKTVIFQKAEKKESKPQCLILYQIEKSWQKLKRRVTL